ncbi:MAG: hypothetical protein ISS15_21000 [Alphaproteobacteria bacterium]|nr:hypothetical protein [Reyranella sp.]MBL7100144.1 hypothetical protein [Alphaproteobacteria bacterium]
MIDKDLARLIARDERADLRRLERDVWHREAALQSLARASRRLASWQGLVLAVAILTSATIGMSSGMALAQHANASPFTTGEKLAPSTLLFGGGTR